jgi:hypothetical protein
MLMDDAGFNAQLLKSFNPYLSLVRKKILQEIPLWSNMRFPSSEHLNVTLGNSLQAKILASGLEKS